MLVNGSAMMIQLSDANAAQYPLLSRSGQTIAAQRLSAMCQKQTYALQHDRHKKKDRQRGGLSEIRSGAMIRRLRAQCFGFLRQPSRPIAPRQVAKSGERGGMAEASDENTEGLL